MVRVFSAYQFAGQSIQCINGDVCAACIIDAKQLVLAKSNHVIEIVTLRKFDKSDSVIDAATASNENEIERQFTFPSVDEVKQMVYCKFGNYIATIERKSTNNGEQSYCRIYTNWPPPESFNSNGSDRTSPSSASSESSVNVTIRARIAGKVTPSSAHGNCLEVIEIPISKIVGHNAHANCDDYESTSSSAGCTTTSSRFMSHPANCYPHQIASCQETGTLICAIHRCIKLYKFIECTKDNTHFKYIDFVELPFEVDLDFVPIHLTINEHIIGCGNREFMCVFKLLERNCCNAADSDDMMSANSLTTSSELSGTNAFGISIPAVDRCNGAAFGDMNDVNDGAPIHNYVDDYGQVFDFKNASKKCLSSITSNISSSYDQTSNDPFGNKSKFDKNRGSSEFRPLFIENSVPLCNLRHLTPTCAENASDEFYKDYIVKTLLQIKQHDAVTDPFQSLVIQPIYMNSIAHASGSDGGKDCSDAMDASNNIFRSVESRKFVGISILLATINDGYLYQFSNNEKWTMSEDELQNSCLIATYPFTSPIVDVRITDYVVHALTDHGIETYTHRIGHKLFSCSYEYNLRDDLFTIEACPRVEEPICLIGLRPFLGIQKMLATDQNLILLASSTNKSTPNKASKDQMKRNDIPSANWTVYNLKMAQADVLYHDFIELANSHIGNSPKLYAHLLSEAHMILRIAKEVSFHSKAPTMSTGDDPRASLEYNDRMNRLFLESCLHLADICVMSPHRDEYCLAYPYYAMSQITINETFDRIVRLLNENDNERTTVGAVYTLKSMIIKSTESAESIGHRLTATHITSGNYNQTFGDKLLEFFAKHAPNEIAIIGLNSSTFRELMSAKLCDVILRTKSDGKLTNEDKLCIILESIRSNQRGSINELLLSFTAADLYHLLITHWPLLFETTRVKKTGKFVTAFSEFMESYLMPAVSTSQTISVATLAVLKNLLVDTHIIGIELVLKLFMNYLAAHFGQADAYLSAQSILENILEAYFHNLYVVRGYADSLSSASDAFAKGGFSQRADECHLNGYGVTKNGISRNPNNNNYNNNVNDSLCSHASGDSDRTSSSAATNMSENSLDQMTAKRSETHDDETKRMQFYATGNAVHSDALKILIRIYLGALKMNTDSDKSGANRLSAVTTNAIQMKYIKFMRENFNKIYSNHVLHATQMDTKPAPITPRVEENHVSGGQRALRASDIKRMQASFYFDSNHGIKLQKTPILFLSRRPSYLNGMRPIGDDEQLKAALESKAFLDSDHDEHRKTTIIVLKLQSLLSSGKLTRDILQEIMHFIEANTPFVGVDSFLTLLMPFDLCVDYLIELCPEQLLEYAKNCITDDQRWQQLLLRITMQRKRIIQNRSQTFYENLLKEHLDCLVHTKRLSEILNIFPVKYIGDNIDRDTGDDDDETTNDPNGGISDKLNTLPLLNGVECETRRTNVPIKNSDYEFFTQYLKMAIDLDRSERLSEMIKTTGLQLYNTIAGNNLNADTVGTTNGSSN